MRLSRGIRCKVLGNRSRLNASKRSGIDMIGYNTKKLLTRRVWLRPVRSWGPQSSFHSKVDVTLNQYETKKKLPRQEQSLAAEIGFRDCGNYISFDFDAETEHQYELQLKAMDKLLSEITLVRDAWVKARTLLIERGGWKSNVHYKKDPA